MTTVLDRTATPSFTEHDARDAVRAITTTEGFPAPQHVSINAAGTTIVILVADRDQVDEWAAMLATTAERFGDSYGLNWRTDAFYPGLSLPLNVFCMLAPVRWSRRTLSAPAVLVGEVTSPYGPCSGLAADKRDNTCTRFAAEFVEWAAPADGTYVRRLCTPCADLVPNVYSRRPLTTAPGGYPVEKAAVPAVDEPVLPQVKDRDGYLYEVLPDGMLSGLNAKNRGLFDRADAEEHYGPLIEVAVAAPDEPKLHRYVSVSLAANGWVGKCACGVGGFGHDSKEEAHESLMAHLGADHEAVA